MVRVGGWRVHENPHKIFVHAEQHRQRCFCAKCKTSPVVQVGQINKIKTFLMKDSKLELLQYPLCT